MRTPPAGAGFSAEAKSTVSSATSAIHSPEGQAVRAASAPLVSARSGTVAFICEPPSSSSAVRSAPKGMPCTSPAGTLARSRPNCRRHVSPAARRFEANAPKPSSAFHAAFVRATSASRQTSSAGPKGRRASSSATARSSFSETVRGAPPSLRTESVRSVALVPKSRPSIGETYSAPDQSEGAVAPTSSTSPSATVSFE